VRYLPHTEATRQAMLDVMGLPSTDALFSGIGQAEQAFALPPGQPEMAVEQDLRAMAARNLHAGHAPFFLGAGVYHHHIPASVDHLIQRGEFLTSYTPYQPEISQGTLQALFEFQTLVARLTGMEIANASLYDGSNATVEAALMACRITRREQVLVSGNLHPHYRQTLETYSRWTDFTLQALPPVPHGQEDLLPLLGDSLACVIVQYPDFYGHVQDFRALAGACHEKGILLIAVVTEIVSLGALEPPGAWGADIVAAEGQSLGVPMSLGGPHVGLFACRQEYVRQMPGRLCGETMDVSGRRGFVLTLSTREQHIRREKATSNICTNSGLCALAFTIHMSLLGGQGLAHLAALNHAYAVACAQRLEAIPGVRVLNQTFFNEFTVELPKPAAPVVEALAAQNLMAGLPLSRVASGQDRLLLVAVTEMTPPEKQALFAKALEAALQ
jgi:glycine dehydrogenase subunit 1